MIWTLLVGAAVIYLAWWVEGRYGLDPRAVWAAIRGRR
jgi:hypothetical protein